MAQQRPVTGHPVPTGMEADILSAGRPLAETLPSFEAFYLTEIAGLVTPGGRPLRSRAGGGRRAGGDARDVPTLA